MKLTVQGDESNKYSWDKASERRELYREGIPPPEMGVKVPWLKLNHTFMVPEVAHRIAAVTQLSETKILEAKQCW